jgi:glycosyltransferase involved in cell wall biosynthesis
MTVDYSIIVPAYNEEAYLPSTLAILKASMAALTEFRGEIIVTNNNSTDRTAEIAEASGARVVFEEHQQIARARNVGGKEAHGRYLIFVDADTRISPALLRKTLTALESGSNCGGGTIAEYDAFPPLVARGGLKVWLFISRTFKWASGAYVFCPRQAFLDTGGFDERYYAAEEIFFSGALKRWGKRSGKAFVILDEPIITSSRKLEWYGLSGIAIMILGMFLHLRPLQNREACERIWYRRPGDDG